MARHGMAIGWEKSEDREVCHVRVGGSLESHCLLWVQYIHVLISRVGKGDLKVRGEGGRRRRGLFYLHFYSFGFFLVIILLLLILVVSSALWSSLNSELS